MAWKASSTPLFVVGALQQHGNLTRPAQHTKFPVSYSIHVSCVSQAKTAGICADRYLGYHHLPSQHCSRQSTWNIPIWCSGVLWNTITNADGLKKRTQQNWNRNLCLWQKYFYILHLGSLHLRLLNTKKGLKLEQAKEFFPSEKFIPKLWHIATTISKTSEKQDSSNTGIRHYSWDHNSWPAKTTFPLD